MTPESCPEWAFAALSIRRAGGMVGRLDFGRFASGRALKNQRNYLRIPVLEVLLGMQKAPVVAAFSAKAAPEPPAELEAAGRHLWRTVMNRYVIEETHAEVLKLACLSADSAAAMRKQISEDGSIVIGSQGQPVAHPLIAAEGAAEKRVAQLLKQVGLFDERKRDKPGRPPKFGGF
jgi:P27 family predicted phage terminase small subunit